MNYTYGTLFKIRESLPEFFRKYHKLVLSYQNSSDEAVEYCCFDENSGVGSDNNACGFLIESEGNTKLIENKCMKLENVFETRTKCRGIFEKISFIPGEQKQLFRTISQLAHSYEIMKNRKHLSSADIKNITESRVAVVNCTGILADMCKKFDEMTLSSAIDKITLGICWTNSTNLCDNYLTEYETRSDFQQLALSNCENKSVVLLNYHRLQFCLKIFSFCKPPERHSFCSKLEYRKSLEDISFLANNTDKESVAKRLVNLYRSKKMNTTLLEPFIKDNITHKFLIYHACHQGPLSELCDLLLERLNEKSKDDVFSIIQPYCFTVKKMMDDSANSFLCENIEGKLCLPDREHLICPYFGTFDDLQKYAREILQRVSSQQTQEHAKVFLEECGLLPEENWECDLRTDLWVHKDHLLKNFVLTCSRMQPQFQLKCEETMKFKVQRQPQHLQEYCFATIKKAALHTSDEQYCKSIYNVTKSVGNGVNATTFEKWHELVNVYKKFSNDKKSKMYIGEMAQFFNSENMLFFPYENYHQEVLYDLSNVQTSLLVQKCQSKNNRCKFWLKYLHNKLTLLNVYKNVCDRKDKQAEQVCQNIQQECVDLKVDCFPINEFFLETSFDPLACQIADFRCKVAFERHCSERQNYRCEMMLQRMGSAKLIEVLATCEDPKVNWICYQIFESLSSMPPHSKVLTETYIGYCEAQYKEYGFACTKIVNNCFDKRRFSCYYILDRFDTVFRTLLWHLITWSIAGIILSLCMGLRRKWIRESNREERRDNLYYNHGLGRHYD